MGINTYDDTWATVSQALNERIEQLRTDLESDLDPEETAEVRGKIRMAREILALPEPNKPAPAAESGNYID